MTDQDRKARVREYKETPRPAGIYQIRNTAKNISLLGSSVNLPGILNRHRFELQNGSHRIQELQRDWNELGAQAFEFKVLDELKHKQEPGYDPAEDLAILLEMWLEKIRAAGAAVYGATGQRKPVSTP